MFNLLPTPDARYTQQLTKVLTALQPTRVPHWAPVTYVITIVLTLLYSYEAGWGIEAALLLSAAITFTLASLNLPQRLLAYKTQIVLVFHTFVLLTYWYITTDNLLVFFFIYELFLLPSSYLVLKVSPNKRAIKSTTYFIWWTQAGSMLVLCGLLVQVLTNGTLYFTEIKNLHTLAGILVLLGFGVKIPVFPFFFWLTKTHVEAITSFSIFLSGFLVKLALYGLVKLQYFATIAAAPAVTPLILVSITVATLSFVYQTDYKKLIAYATVQEMNILTLLYLLTAQSGPDVVAALLIVHTLLSGLFFTIADLLYKKYNTRALTALKGLLLVAPKLSTLIIIAVLVFKGLPYTAKFPIEFTLYSLLMQSNALLAVFLLALLVFFGNLIFTIINMAILFGTPKQGSAITDLTTKELGLIIIPLAWLVGLVI